MACEAFFGASVRTRDQISLLKMLALGQKAIDDGNVTDHDNFFAELEAEDEEVGSED